LFSPHSEWSFIPAISRELLTRHLLPLLSEVAKHQEQNKMTSENLAVCFAPTFVCGPDQMEDIKISNMLRRIIATAVDEWPRLREVFAIEEKTFWDDLKAPSNIDDYEDPLYERSTTPERAITSHSAGTDTQRSGILLKDNVNYDSDQSDGLVDPRPSTPPLLPPRSGPLSMGSPPAPALPPRISTTGPIISSRAPTSDPSSTTTAFPADQVLSPSSAIRRKPAPPLSLPPRYSVVVGSQSNELSDSPTSYTGPVDGFGPPRRGDWSLYSDDVTRNSSASPTARSASGGLMRRKPVGSGDEGKGSSLKD